MRDYLYDDQVKEIYRVPHAELRRLKEDPDLTKDIAQKRDTPSSKAWRKDHGLKGIGWDEEEGEWDAYALPEGVWQPYVGDEGLEVDLGYEDEVQIETVGDLYWALEMWNY